MDVPAELPCKYNGGMCPNLRAVRNNKLLRVCEFHRHRANVHQKDYQRRRKSQSKMIKSTGRATPMPRPVQPSVASVQTAGTSEPAAPAPLVVFVLASEMEIGQSLHLLSNAGTLSVGQPYQVVSADQLQGFLRCMETSSATSGVDACMDSMTLEPCQMKQTVEDLEPLPYVAGFEELEALLFEHAGDFVSSLFAKDDWPTGLFA